jgi:hypothetical protein
MKYRRTLLKTLALLGPMAVALSYATEPAHADDYDWCRNYYNYYHDPRCAYLYDDTFPNGFFFFGDDRRFHHHFDHDGDHDDHHGDHDHDPRHDGPRHDPGGVNHGGSGGFNHGGFGGSDGFNHRGLGGFNHGGSGGSRSPGPGMFIPGGAGHGR